MADRFQVLAQTNDDGDKVSYYSEDIRVTPDSDGRVFIQLDTNTAHTPESSNLAYRNCNATIIAKNDFGGSNSAEEILFSKLVYVNG